MNDERKQLADRHDEAQTLAMLCAQANAARRVKMTIRMDGSTPAPARTPRRLVAAN